MNLEYTKVERTGPVTTIFLNRPEVMNALHQPANLELQKIFDDFVADREQWVAIVTGEGSKAFCAGNDLKYQASGGGDLSLPPSGFGGITSRFDLNKPVIAAVNGLAMGGGFEIVLACDIVVASDTAVFALPEPRVGLAALAGGLHRLPRQIGMKAAMGMILTGRRVSAQEGKELGFINEVVPLTEVREAALRWAGDICACSPMSLRASKEAVLKGLEGSLTQAISEQWKYPAMRELFRSEDIKEGPRAFAEKRKPNWEAG